MATRRAVVALLGACTLGLLAGCSADDGGADSAGSSAAAVVAPAADCQSPQVLDALGLTPAPGAAATTPSSATPHPDAPAEGTVPRTFVAVSALACTPGGQLTDSAGTWSSVQATSRDGDMTALKSALELPSLESTDAATCDDVPLQLWLVDALGRAVRVQVPTDACGVGPRAEVGKALAGLTTTDTATYPVGLLVPSSSPTP